MLPVRFDPPAAKYIKKLKDKKLKKLYQEAIDKIRELYFVLPPSALLSHDSYNLHLKVPRI